MICVLVLAATLLWGSVAGPPPDSPTLRSCQVERVLASPEWGTVVRHRNARALSALRASQAAERGEGAGAIQASHAGVVPVPGPSSRIDWRPEVERWRPLVAAYFRPGEVEHALAIIRCESLGDPEAINPSSGTVGLFQHRPAYWPARSSASGWAGHSPLEPEASIAVAAWLVREEGGWIHWSGRPWGVDSCEEWACAQGVC